MSKPVTALDVLHALSTVIAQFKGIASVVKVGMPDLVLLRDSLALEIDEAAKAREQLKKEREAHKKEKDLAAANYDALRKERDGLLALLAIQKQSEQSRPNPFDTHTYPPLTGRGDAWIRNQQRIMEQEKVSLSQEVGAKHDGGKLRYSLLPKGTITEVLKVLEFGAKKYAPDNWMKVDNAQTRYYDAALRHITAWHEGEKFDQETGVSHIAHALCCLHFLMWFELNR